MLLVLTKRRVEGSAQGTAVTWPDIDSSDRRGPRAVILEVEAPMSALKAFLGCTQDQAHLVLVSGGLQARVEDPFLPGFAETANPPHLCLRRPPQLHPRLACGQFGPVTTYPFGCTARGEQLRDCSFTKQVLRQPRFALVLRRHQPADPDHSQLDQLVAQSRRRLSHCQICPFHPCSDRFGVILKSTLNALGSANWRNRWTEPKNAACADPSGGPRRTGRAAKPTLANSRVGAGR